MAINTWKIWKWFGLTSRQITADADTDIEAVMNYLDDVHRDVDSLKEQFRKLKELRREASVLTDKSALSSNMRKQVSLYDQLLLNYEYHDIDTSINAIRVKNVAMHYLEQVKKYKLYDFLDKIKKQSHWFF